MEILNYKAIDDCYVCGSIDSGIEIFINKVTRNLSDSGEEFVHPKELERQERLKRKAQERAAADVTMTNLGRLADIEIDMGRYGDEPIQTDSRFEKKFTKSKRSKNGYNNSVIIVCGNCGIGIKSEHFYQSFFNRFNNTLKKNNCHILFVRGNNDNPSFFEEDKLNFSNIKCVKDYTVVQFKNFNCLCIGGAVSIDRKWKTAQGERLGKKLYWENETAICDEEKLDEITSKYNIACVVTCTSPSFAFPGTNAFSRSKWVSEDKQVSLDLIEERKVMDRIYNKLTENGMKPYMWFYGKFNQQAQNNINDMIFWSLNSFNIISFNNAIAENFGINVTEKLSSNKNVFNSLTNDDSNMLRLTPYDYEANGIEGADEDEHIEDLLGAPENDIVEQGINVPNMAEGGHEINENVLGNTRQFAYNFDGVDAATLQENVANILREDNVLDRLREEMERTTAVPTRLNAARIMENANPWHY